MRILSAIVNLSDLSIDPANVRKTGRGKEPKFAASIRVRGVLEPLIVRSDPKGDGYLIINGGERFTALQYGPRRACRYGGRPTEERQEGRAR